MTASTSETSRPHRRTVTVGHYLATRLGQLGCHQFFGAAADSGLELVKEMVTVAGSGWVGCTTELNAAHAADGYARTRRGVGALVTSYAAGEMSAISGIAGSHAQYVPVVQITGLPPTRPLAETKPGVADSTHERSLRALREVTVAGVVVTLETATDEIDRILLAALHTNRPVYLGIPTDVAGAQVPADSLLDLLPPPRSDPESLSRFRDALRPLLAGHSSLTLLAGTQILQQRLEGALSAIADLPGVAIASQVGALTLTDPDHRSSLGTYLGLRTRSEVTRVAVDRAPLLVLAGATHGDLSGPTAGQEVRPRPAVELSIVDARIGDTAFTDLRMEDSLWILCDAIEMRSFPGNRPPARPVGLEDEVSPVLTGKRFWETIQRWLPPGMSTVADLATVLRGAEELHLPNDSEWLAQPMWSPSGYTLPAVLGVCEATAARRVLLLIGDAAAQPAIQELGTILRRGHTPIVVLLHTDTAHADLPHWNWAALVAALSPGVSLRASTVGTPSELAQALDEATACTDRAVFIEAAVPSDTHRP